MGAGCGAPSGVLWRAVAQLLALANLTNRLASQSMGEGLPWQAGSRQVVGRSPWEQGAVAKPKPGTVFELPDISWGYSV